MFLKCHGPADMWKAWGDTYHSFQLKNKTKQKLGALREQQQKNTPNNGI